MSALSDQVFLAGQRLLPKRLLTEAIGLLARCEGGRLTQAAIRWFVKRYDVDMAEAQQAAPSAYRTFNEFFTRPLRPEVRPIAASRWICPVDGRVSECGIIDGGMILQAKSHRYSCAQLLGGDTALAAYFDGGVFATLYLSPRDYHRIHMPAAGRLLSMSHIPGSLYSVNPLTAANLSGLFARNERVVCVFENGGVRFAMVLVGATIVGSMATVWHGVVNPPRPQSIRRWDYADEPVTLEQGGEMGRFLLGSTVIMLAPRSEAPRWPSWAAGRPVRLGEAMSP